MKWAPGVESVENTKESGWTSLTALEHKIIHTCGLELLSKRQDKVIGVMTCRTWKKTWIGEGQQIAYIPRR